MPAAAVIPAPLAYIKVVAVKTLVVGSLPGLSVRLSGATVQLWANSVDSCGLLLTEWPKVVGMFTLKKLECSEQATCLNRLAWDNRTGRRFYSSKGSWNPS